VLSCPDSVRVCPDQTQKEKAGRAREQESFRRLVGRDARAGSQADRKLLDVIGTLEESRHRSATVKSPLVSVG
jgi:hypothetical protein